MFAAVLLAWGPRLPKQGHTNLSMSLSVSPATSRVRRVYFCFAVWREDIFGPTLREKSAVCPPPPQNKTKAQKPPRRRSSGQVAVRAAKVAVSTWQATASMLNLLECRFGKPQVFQPASSKRMSPIVVAETMSRLNSVLGCILLIFIRSFFAKSTYCAQALVDPQALSAC